MPNKTAFNWKYLIPGYGCYEVHKSEGSGKAKFYLLNIMITFFVLGFLAGPENDTSSANAVSESKPAVEEEETYRIGDALKTEKFEIKISPVSVKKYVGNQYFNSKAAEGAVFLIINFRYKNISGKPLSSYSMPEIELMDPNGTKYDEASGATEYYHTAANINKNVISDLNPGITQKDAAVFEISSELWKKKGWKLTVDADDDFQIEVK